MDFLEGFVGGLGVVGGLGEEAKIQSNEMLCDSEFGDEDFALLPDGSVKELKGQPAEAVAGLSEILFVGTGSSAGTPMLSCLLNDQSECQVCRDAVANPESKNNKGNPSILIRYRANSEQGAHCKQNGVQKHHANGTGESAISAARSNAQNDAESTSPTVKGESVEMGKQLKETNVLIDVGKTFKRSAMRFFPRNKVRKVHAIVLTHEHADAVLGLDDVRELNPWNPRKPGALRNAEQTPVFLNKETYAHVDKAFSYLTKKPDPSKGEVVRMVSQLDFREIQNSESFDAMGLKLRSVPMEHGSDCTCLGFIFGQNARVAYLSDFVKLPQETMDVVMEQPVDLLVLDTLLRDQDTTTHQGLQSAIKIAKLVRPTKTLLVGVSHSFGDHTKSNAELKYMNELSSEGLSVQLAHDGQRIFLQL